MRFYLPLFIALVSTSLCSAELNMPEDIVFGAIYNLFHEEFDSDEDFQTRIDRDIPNIAEANLNTVMVFPMNQWDRETKTLEWGRTDYLINQIDKQKLRFVPILFKEEQGRHYLPIWAFEEIPGLWEQHANGNLNSRENVDPQNPQVRAWLDRYLEAVIGRYGNRESLLMYNIWNEPHYVSHSDLAHNQFTEWLQEKYSDLNTISRVWGEDYTDWSQVTIRLNDNWESSMQQIDWTLFTYDLNANILASLREKVRELDPSTPVNGNPVGTVWTNYDIGSRYTVDNWPLAREGDIHGISHYPDIWERQFGKTFPFYRHGFIFNHVRSAAADKPWFLSEVQTYAQNGLAQNGYFDYDTMHLMTWYALANDCKGILYWKWLPFLRGRQTFGRGLCRTDGELSTRGKAVKDVGGVLKKHGKRLFRAHPIAPETAILLDMVGLQKSFEPKNGKAPENIMRQAYEGTYLALTQANIPVDIIRTDQAVNRELLTHYKVLILPFQMVVAEKTAELLKQFVKAGGTLIADARTAIMDDRDFGYAINPGAGLDEVFGVKRVEYIGTHGSHNVQTTSGTLFESPIHYQGVFYRETWDCADSAEVLATFESDGAPALVKNHFGKGTAYLSAVPLGASLFHSPENPVQDVIVTLTQSGGVNALVTWQESLPENPEVFVSIHESDNELIVYLINSSSENFSNNLYFKKGLKYEADSVSKLSEFGDIEILNTQTAYPVHVTIPSHRTLIFSLDF